MLNTVTSYAATVTKKKITTSHPLHLYSPVMEKKAIPSFFPA